MTSETVLYRQAYPKFMDGDDITSQVFIPFPKDNGNLSVYDGDKIDAAGAYRHYTEQLGLESDSVWAVMKIEADEVGTTAEPDPLPDFESHAKLNFNKLPEKEWRKAAKKLKKLAQDRGRLHPSTPDG